jgi:hypothetical protein
MVAGLPLPLLKICDFGYSKAHHMSAPKSKVGTLAYMAPEIIKATGEKGAPGGRALEAAWELRAARICGSSQQSRSRAPPHPTLLDAPTPPHPTLLDALTPPHPTPPQPPTPSRQLRRQARRHLVVRCHAVRHAVWAVPLRDAGAGRAYMVHGLGACAATCRGIAGRPARDGARSAGGSAPHVRLTRLAFRFPSSPFPRCPAAPRWRRTAASAP